MGKENPAATDTQALTSRITALEKSIETLEKTIAEQTQRLNAKVAEHQRAQAALRRSETSFRQLLETAPDGMVIVNATHEIVMVNEQIEKLFGYDRRELIGKPVEMLVPPRFVHHRDFSKAFIGAPRKRLMGQGGTLYALRKDGSEFPVEISLSPLETPEGLIVSAAIRDITERQRFEAQLEFQSNHDPLTGLPNRNLLLDRLQQALNHVRREQGRVALLVIDLDNFKLINDSLGYGAGDRLLKLVAERLAACVRAGDTVARPGGDEFVVVLIKPSKSEDVAHVAQKFREAVAAPLRIDEHELVISCSIGISMFPGDGEDAPTLLKNADAAMYRAKEQGRDTFRFYTGELNERVMTRLTMEKHLRRALEREEFILHYQPQIDLRTGRITGMEALLRWQSPELGLVAPGRFIPLAEETGLIVPIGEWVLRVACSQNRAWQEAGLSPLTMATNLSARQFWHHDLLATVARALEESGLEPRYLELEIIESMVMQDVEAAVAMAGELKKLGAQLTMDDFGTGYSSLSYLKRFPFDKLKIDLSFVREITTDPGSAAIARTIIAMAHNLNLRAIAEGVETEGQLGYLRAHGCDEMQGFYFSRPLPAAEFERLLVEQRHLQLPAESLAAGEPTVLVVDDEAQVAAALGEVLRGDGYRILTAASAREGLELLAVHRVGVILADHRMPEMSGAEFLGRAKELYPQTVRIALSGYADLDTVTEAVNRGAIFKFITKPWDPGALRQDVREAFRYSELAEERQFASGEAERRRRAGGAKR